LANNFVIGSLPMSLIPFAPFDFILVLFSFVFVCRDLVDDSTSSSADGD
jgi:hypothetical protein